MTDRYIPLGIEVAKVIEIIGEHYVDAWRVHMVTHKPCQGTGRLHSCARDVLADHEHTRHCPTVVCPGPHTEIEITDLSTYKPATHLEPSEIDGFVLYVDPERIEWICDYPEFADNGCIVLHDPEATRQPRKHQLCHWVLALPIPSGWTFA